MKTKKKLFSALVLAALMIVLFVGGCKKNLESDSTTKLEAPPTYMNTVGVGGPVKVLRQSPGLKVEVTGAKIPRISEKPRYPEKLIALLKEQSKKKKAEGVTVSDATFSATLSGSTYSASVDFPDITGDREFWLVNTLTWVYTYVAASSTSYASFNIAKPAMYGTYRVWCEGENQQTQFSNEIYLGDPYSGVSLVNGILEFTDRNALQVILDRLEQAMEDHASNFADPLDYLTEDQLTDYAISVGFDEYLPMKEFEAYFGFYSLRQKIETEEAAWLALSDPWAASVIPDDAYDIDDDEERTVHNQYSQVKVDGNLIEPVSVSYPPTSETPCGPELWFCEDRKKVADTEPLPNNKVIHWKITKKSGESGNSPSDPNGDMWFNSYVKAQIRRFRKKDGVWSKSKAKMSVQLVGTVYKTPDGYTFCTPANVFDTFDETKSYKKRYRRKEKESWNKWTYVKACEVYANFTVEGYTFTKYLR